MLFTKGYTYTENTLYKHILYIVSLAVYNRRYSVSGHNNNQTHVKYIYQHAICRQFDLYIFLMRYAIIITVY